MTRASAGNRFRTRKLSPKQSLAIIREYQIDSTDEDVQRNIPQIETGVERQEEIEHHLQAAISASQAAAVGGKVTQIFIPTPDASKLVSKYDSLYPRRFSQPASYIRFSSTVEDCSGVSYCMSVEDDKYLEKLNTAKRPVGAQCTEEQFEMIMDHYENMIQQRQPYLSMDVSNILPYEELETTFTGVIEGALKNFARAIYSHWREQKIARGGQPLIPVLKSEQGNDKDDGDPYVCFRRREVRITRKTRRTDAQSTEKLKRIRTELATAGNLLKDVITRETVRKNGFVYDQSIFENRRALQDLKRKLGIKGDDEDLVNHKPRRRPIEQGVPTTSRIPLRQDGKPPEAELKQLAHVKAEAEKRRLEKKQELRNSRPIPKFGVVDLTKDALFSSSQPMPTGPATNFCGVQAYYLPSPPPSSGSPVSSPGMDMGQQTEPQKQISVVQASPKTPLSRGTASFRRRMGRGGRVMIDRRGPESAPSPDASMFVLDRQKYDQEDDGFQLTYHMDPNSIENIQFRSRMLSPPPETTQSSMYGRRPMMGSPVVHQHSMSNGHPVPIMTNPQLMVNGQHAAMIANVQQSPRQQHPMLNGQHQQSMINSNPGMQQAMINSHGSAANQIRR